MHVSIHVRPMHVYPDTVGLCVYHNHIELTSTSKNVILNISHKRPPPLFFFEKLYLQLLNIIKMSECVHRSIVLGYMHTPSMSGYMHMS